MSIVIRKAAEKDVETVHHFIHKLANFEELSDSCKITVDGLRKLMIDEKSLFALVAEVDGVPVGFAAYYFFKIATFSGKKVLYLEDLYVSPEYRHLKIGYEIVKMLKTVAKDEDCSRLEWKCLEWNKNAINFYEKIGAQASEGWITYTIDSDKF